MDVGVERSKMRRYLLLIMFIPPGSFSDMKNGALMTWNCWNKQLFICWCFSHPSGGTTLLRLFFVNSCHWFLLNMSPQCEPWRKPELHYWYLSIMEVSHRSAVHTVKQPEKPQQHSIRAGTQSFRSHEGVLCRVMLCSFVKEVLKALEESCWSGIWGSQPV